MGHTQEPRSALFLGILAPILLCSACSGSSVETPEGMEKAPDGTAVPANQGSLGACVEARTSANGVFDATTRKTWNAADRILTATTTYGSDSSTLKWRYRADGQIIAYIGIEQPFQHDYQYDEQGDRSDFYLSYPAAPDLMMPSSAEPWMGSAYANEYDEGGRLVASTTTEYGPGAQGLPPNRSTFSEDADGRCVGIDAGNYGQRVISYDAAGRVAQIVKTGAAQGFCVNATTTTTYDDAGRVLETKMECSGGNSGPNNGGIQLTTHSYHPDGSETVDYVDGLTDVGDGRSSTTRTAACLVLDAAIGKPADARCRVALTP
jgi:hypothetical protein